MANVFYNLPTFAANQVGTPVDVSAMGALKTITVAQTGAVFQPYVTIEFSNEFVPVSWTPLKTFQSAGQQSFTVAARWMRASVSNYITGPAPNCDVPVMTVERPSRICQSLLVRERARPST